MILTMTPDPIEISATRVYMDRGLTMATFGLYCAGVQEQARDTLALPDSLKVAVQLDDGTVVEAEQAETLHCQITLRVGCAPRTEGWTVDKADLPDMAIQKMPTDCDTTPAVYYTTSADPEELDVTKKLRNLTIEELIEDPLQTPQRRYVLSRFYGLSLRKKRRLCIGSGKSGRLLAPYAAQSLKR